ncbi:hypothetical protein F4805DRAFT_455378 [Annulohypoxylon moriforme]|nr:hypothetical protein F4805DRAFT_455378 [Annulohypoxylon moriforme]
MDPLQPHWPQASLAASNTPRTNPQTPSSKFQRTSFSVLAPANVPLPPSRPTAASVASSAPRFSIRVPAPQPTSRGGTSVKSIPAPPLPGTIPASFSGGSPFVPKSIPYQAPVANGPPTIGPHSVSVPGNNIVDSLDLARLRLSGKPPLAPSLTSLQKFERDITDAKRMALPCPAAGLYKKACSVDLLFLIDTTGSMGPYIEAARKQVQDIVAEAKKAFLNESPIRVAVVGYKDHGDIPNIQFLDFTEDAARVEQFLNGLAASGGSDLAEDVLGGIQQAVNANWSQEARCIVHIADAPAHGRDLHEMTTIGCDRFIDPGSEPHRLTYEPLVNELVSKNINYALLRINETTTTDRMAWAFSTVYKSNHAEGKLHPRNRYYDNSQPSKDFGGRAYYKNNNLVAVLQFEELLLGTTFDSLKHLVIKSIGNSISRTVSRLSSERSAFAGKGMKPSANLPAIREENNEKPEWKKLRVEGKCPELATHSTAIFERMMERDNQITFSFIQLVIDAWSIPFGQGGHRTAAYARTPASTNRFVVKSFKQPGKQIAELDEHTECQAMCRAFAIEFNALVDPSYSIDFVTTVALTSKSSTDVGSKCISLEPYIDGTYVKYNDNYGYVNDDQSNPSNHAAQAFSHFTFERSKGRFLVNDLQGAGNLLTDPAIHTRDENRFKLCNTNLHEEGFKRFMTTHNCNNLCRVLQLRSNKTMLELGGILQFRTSWPNVENMVYCSNKLCRRSMHRTAAGISERFPGYWCQSCWPQLNSSIVQFRCFQNHNQPVSKFFHESQGEAVPLKCPIHPEAVLVQPVQPGFATIKTPLRLVR